MPKTFSIIAEPPSQVNQTEAAARTALEALGAVVVTAYGVGAPGIVVSQVSENISVEVAGGPAGSVGFQVTITVGYVTGVAGIVNRRRGRRGRR